MQPETAYLLKNVNLATTEDRMQSTYQSQIPHASELQLKDQH